MPKLGAQIRNRFYVTLGIFGILVAAFYSKLPAKDRAGYYDFADQTQWLGIPHSIDVLSNLGFTVVGFWGLFHLLKKSGRSLYAPPDIRGFKSWIALAILLTSFGSAYFHIEPGLERIYWDRLPMVFCFGGIIGWVIADRVNLQIGWLSGFAVFIFGSVALTLWRVGLMDLRPYFVLQFGGFFFVIALCLLFKNGTYPRSRILGAMAIYAFAKIFEVYDSRILEALGVLSGHSLKHFAAAYSIHLLLTAPEAESLSRGSLRS